MKYYLDTQFHEYKKNGIDTIDLLSLGLLSESDEMVHFYNKDFDVKDAWLHEYVRESVLPKVFENLYDIHIHETNNIGDLLKIEEVFNINNLTSLLKLYGKTKEEIKNGIISFVGDNKAQFVGYYADYDWVCFCKIFGKMIDLPKNFSMYAIDLKQTLDEKLRIENGEIIKVEEVKDHKLVSVVGNKIENYPNFPTKSVIYDRIIANHPLKNISIANVIWLEELDNFLTNKL